MQPLRLVIWALAVTVAGLAAPLAYASLPDPLWIPGIYDDDDQDEVIVAAANTVGSVDGLPAGPAAPTCVGDCRVFDRDASEPSSAVASSLHGRAPPLFHPLPLI